jgi:hypothetical protein
MTRPVIALLGALFAPFIIIAIYASLSRSPERWFTTGSDYMAIGLATLVGFVAVWSLPLKDSQRFIGLMLYLLYVPAMGALIVLALLMFVCRMYGDCL